MLRLQLKCEPIKTIELFIETFNYSKALKIITWDLTLPRKKMIRKPLYAFNCDNVVQHDLHWVWQNKRRRLSLQPAIVPKRYLAGLWEEREGKGDRRSKLVIRSSPSLMPFSSCLLASTSRTIASRKKFSDIKGRWCRKRPPLHLQLSQKNQPGERFTLDLKTVC